MIVLIGKNQTQAVVGVGAFCILRQHLREIAFGFSDMLLAQENHAQIEAGARALRLQLHDTFELGYCLRKLLPVEVGLREREVRLGQVGLLLDDRLQSLDRIPAAFPAIQGRGSASAPAPLTARRSRTASTAPKPQPRSP